MEATMDDDFVAPPELAKLAEELTCLICKDIYNGPVSLQCGHMFCSGCIRASFASNIAQNKKLACPKCRAPSDTTDLRRLGAVRQASLALPAAAAAVEALRRRAEDAEARAAVAEQEAATLREQLARQLSNSRVDAGLRPSKVGRHAGIRTTRGTPWSSPAEEPSRASQRGGADYDGAGNGRGRPQEDKCDDDEGTRRPAKRLRRFPGGTVGGTESRRRSGADGGFSDGSDVRGGDDDDANMDFGSPGDGRRGGDHNGGSGDDGSDGDDGDYSPGSGFFGRRGGGSSAQGGRGGRGRASQAPGQIWHRDRPLKSATGSGGNPGSGAGPGAGIAWGLPPPLPSGIADSRGATATTAAASSAPAVPANGMGECPVCGSPYALAQLSAHVEMCIVRCDIRGGVASVGAWVAPAAPPPPPPPLPWTRHGAAAGSSGVMGGLRAASGRGPPTATTAAVATAEPPSQSRPSVEIKIPPRLDFNIMKLTKAREVMKEHGLPVNKGGKQSDMKKIYDQYRNFLMTQRDCHNIRNAKQLLQAFLRSSEQEQRATSLPAVAPVETKGFIELHTARMRTEFEARRRQAASRAAAAAMQSAEPEPAAEPSRHPASGSAQPQADGEGEDELQGQGQGAQQPSGPEPELELGSERYAQEHEPTTIADAAVTAQHLRDGSGGGAHASSSCRRTPGAVTAVGGGPGPGGVQNPAWEGGLLHEVITIDDSEEGREEEKLDQQGQHPARQPLPRRQSAVSAPNDHQREELGDAMAVDSGCGGGRGGDGERRELLGSGSGGSGDEDEDADPDICGGGGSAPDLAACLATSHQPVSLSHPSRGHRLLGAATTHGSAAGVSTPGPARATGLSHPGMLLLLADASCAAVPGQYY